MDNLKLVDPTTDLVAEFRARAEEWREAGEDLFQDVFGDFSAYVERLASNRDPENLPPNLVPMSTFWLLAGDRRVVGTSRLRHWLVPHLEKEGGHIGYDIRPSERRKGYGTALLALTLDKARGLGLREVIVTCDGDNVGSARVIEKNGGQYTSSVVSDRTGKLVNRYRIVVEKKEVRIDV